MDSFNVSESLHVFQPIEPIFGKPALKGDTVISSQGLSVELQDEFEITAGTNITNKSPIVNNKQNQRKKHCCKYCKKLVGNFSRHLISVHNFESEVAALKTSVTKSEKLKILRKVMAEGDALYNKLNPSNPIVRRKSAHTTQRDRCPSCKMLISKHHAISHIRKCCLNSAERLASSIRVDVTREQLRQQEKLNEQMKTHIIPIMRNDSIRKLCQEDNSLILYGNKMCERLLGESQEKTIRNHLRIVARVAEKTMEKDKTISTVEDMFKSTRYDTFVQAIYDICGHGLAEGHEMKKPTTPHQYGPRMRELSDYILTNLMKLKDPANEANTSQVDLKMKIETIQGWQAVYDREFDKQVASLGRKQAERRTFESKQLTPSMEDVQTLIEFVQNMTDKSFTNLNKKFSHEDYNTLSKCLLLRLWIFNRRRVGEVDKLRLKNWLNAKEIDESSDQYKTPSPTEQRFASSYMRLCVQGKLRRPVALLTPKKDMKCYELIISLRDRARISKETIYLFAINDRYIEGTAVMNEFANRSGAKHWALLTGTRLRKQLAASLRYLNLSDEDLRQVAEAMGHTEKTHMVHYRKHDAALHAGRVSKVLMAIDEGTIQNYMGKSLSDINEGVVLEVVPPSEDLVDIDIDIDTLQENVEVQRIEVQTDEALPSSPEPENIQQEQECTPLKKISKRGKYMDSGSKTYTPPSSEVESDSARGNTPGRKRAFSRRKAHKKTKWSLKIKEALKEQFADEITENRCPSSARILHAMQALEEQFPDILNHSPKKVKTFVWNMTRKGNK